MSEFAQDYEQKTRLLAELHEAERENAALRARLDTVMHVGDLEHARMAALIEACEVFAQFVESYDDRSMLARELPQFYSLLRVYGKNARAAVQAVRPQADALLAELADLSRLVGEQNTTIDYQDAMLAELRKTLGAAYYGLMSYACGNSAPALAEEMAAEITRVLGNVPPVDLATDADRQLSNAAEMARRFADMFGGPGPGKESTDGA